MVLTQEQIRKVLKDYFKDKPVKSVYLFGSYAQGTATEKSDVDILFEFQEGTKMTYFGLAQYLLDLEDKLQKKVDLVDEQKLYPRIRPLVDSTKVLIFSK